MPVSKTFELLRTAASGDIDSLCHVNNQVYLDWFMDAATRHSAAAGWDINRLIAGGAGWVVRRHEIDYLLPVKLGEEVVVRTWIETAERASSERRYEIIRTSDGKPVCRGVTIWVWINYSTGRPERIPGEVVRDFSAWTPCKTLN